MKGIALKLFLTVALIGSGWAIGRAQPSYPDFELRIDAPRGETNITCVRGCELTWIERSIPGDYPGQSATFTYACGGGDPDRRCDSGRVGGWIKREPAGR